MKEIEDLGTRMQSKADALTRRVIDSTKAAGDALLNDIRSHAAREIAEARSQAEAIARDVDAIMEAREVLDARAQEFGRIADALRADLQRMAEALSRGERWLDSGQIDDPGTYGVQPDEIEDQEEEDEEVVAEDSSDIDEAEEERARRYLSEVEETYLRDRSAEDGDEELVGGGTTRSPRRFFSQFAGGSPAAEGGNRLSSASTDLVAHVGGYVMGAGAAAAILMLFVR